MSITVDTLREINRDQTENSILLFLNVLCCHQVCFSFSFSLLFCLCLAFDIYIYKEKIVYANTNILLKLGE